MFFGRNHSDEGVTVPCQKTAPHFCLGNGFVRLGGTGGQRLTQLLERLETGSKVGFWEAVWLLWVQFLKIVRKSLEDWKRTAWSLLQTRLLLECQAWSETREKKLALQRWEKMIICAKLRSAYPLEPNSLFQDFIFHSNLFTRKRSCINSSEFTVIDDFSWWLK